MDRLTSYTKEPRPRRDCGMDTYCTPMELSHRELSEPNALVCAHKHVKRGDTLYRLGDQLGSIYPIRAGFFKVCTTTECGGLQVMGFYMRGEIMGLDAV